MRLKIQVDLSEISDIPFNYHYQLHSAIYNLIRKSSVEYSKFLHDTGFIDENKNLKLFTFSRCYFFPKNSNRFGFRNVKGFTLYFSTPIEKSFEHLVLGIFADQIFFLTFQNKKIICQTKNVESLPDPKYAEKMKFTCLSPIAISTMQDKNGKLIQHYLDYMNPDERDHFIENLRNNLIRKYKLVHKQEFNGKEDFDFSFDPVYITKRKGKISKLIDFKRGIKIKAMEAPFTIKADPELIKIGYECGFGEKNSAGFGMVRAVE